MELHKTDSAGKHASEQRSERNVVLQEAKQHK